MSDQQTSRATIAGVLDVASGLMALIGSVALSGLGLIATGILYAIPDDMPPIQWLPLAVFGPMALIVFLAGLTAMIGGVKCIKRSNWAWALAGAVAALLCFMPFGIASMALTVMAEGEFRDGASKTRSQHR